jgi:hypothetical protein
LNLASGHYDKYRTVFKIPLSGASYARGADMPAGLEQGRLTVAKFVAKVLVGGVLVATPAAAAPSWADDYAGFGGPAVQIDAFSRMLAVPLSAPDARFSGPLAQFDPYNATLAVMGLSPSPAVRAGDLYAGYAFLYLGFGGTPVEVDAYNEALAVPASAVDVRFSGKLVQFDPYNATLAATVLPSFRTLAGGDLSGSYAFALGNDVSRLWEGPLPFDK